ncbi:MAG: hypothetical protein LBO05_13210, partial [Deltaproteobacteria bacterium]|nr:hypothetical protein [Deltaproteobacteria bacterium]
MRKKTSQIKAKDYKEAVNKIEFLARFCALFIFAPRIQRIIVKHLNDVLDILRGAESVKDPTNSHLPPSKSINPAKIREKGKHKVGGQEGHEGHTLKQIPNPDVTHDITPQAFKNDPDLQAVGVIARQVHDIKVKSEIIEYRTTVFINTKTGVKFVGEFPASVNAPVQFGTEAKTFVVYLRDHQHISYERIAELLFEVFGV